MKEHFPIFQKHPKLIYLDSAATTQKPKCVIDAISQFYSESYGTVHRAVYQLCKEATLDYEGVRQKIASFLNASFPSEIVFTRGTTTAINLIARSFPFKKGDAVLISETEHHSNIVPWQMVCEQKGLELKVIPAHPSGELLLDVYESLLTPNVKLVSVAHISNALGVIHPIEQMIALAHKKGAKFLVDGAQAAAHLKVDVQTLDPDFYLFSGHKIYGPTGVGVLYGKKELLEAMPPFEGGGDMIDRVSLKHTTYTTAPLKFEAGTPSIASVVGLGAAIDFLQQIGFETLFSHENNLMAYATERLSALPEITLLGPQKNRGAILSFVAHKAHPLDLATLLDCRHIAIRSGHHCAQPTMELLQTSGTARLSLGLYNTDKDIDLFFQALSEILASLS